jgi:hypothetical protein
MNGTSRFSAATESRVASELPFTHETHTASGATRVTSRKPRLLVLTNEEPNQRGGKHLLERLETENAELRDKAVELALQIQVLRASISVAPLR